MKKLKIVLLCFLLLLAGCNDQRILEELGFIQAISYDKEDEAEEEYRITFRLPKTDEAVQIESEVLTTLAANTKDARLELARHTDRNLVSGQLRLALFGTEVAEEGVREHLDTLIRDPTIGIRTRILVVNGNANELLSRDYDQHARTSRYIERLIDKETRMNMIPEVDLYSFTRDLLDDGIDPVASIIRQGAEDIIIDGIALFDEDQFVAKLDAEEGFIFFFAREKTRLGDLSIHLEEDESKEKEEIMLTSLLSSRKIDVNVKEDKTITANVVIEVKGSVLQYDGELDLSEKRDQKKLEEKIANYVEMKVERMAEKMQEVNADSFGIGKYVRAELSYEEWEELDWKETYKNINVTSEVNVVVRDYGTIKFIGHDGE